MRPDADETFADLLLLRCPERRDEILGMLPEIRRRELGELLDGGSGATKAELAGRISGRFARAAAERHGQLARSVGREVFEQIPVVLRRRLARSQ